MFLVGHSHGLLQHDVIEGSCQCLPLNIAYPEFPDLQSSITPAPSCTLN